MAYKCRVPGETWEQFNSDNIYSRLSFKKWIKNGYPLSSKDMKRLNLPWYRKYKKNYK